MVAIAYLMPPVVCLFVFYVCGIDTPEPYAWILVSGWAAAGLTHRLCYRNRTKATEYLGAFIWGLFYEEPWTEREVIVETYTDKNGNTHERRRVVYTHHSEVFYFKTNIGTRHLISSKSYSLICTTWNAPRHGDLWSGSEIVGGCEIRTSFLLCRSPRIRKCSHGKTFHYNRDTFIYQQNPKLQFYFPF